jgi:negative regulator of flagellin synthesis FlgM
VANTIDRISGNGNRSAAEGIPRSASDATRGNRSAAEGIPRSAGDATRDAQSVGASRSGQQSGREASVTSANPQSEAGDEVQITNTATQLASIGQGLSASSPIDEARVARISQALADGSYTISAQQIASGLLQSEQALEQIGL